MNKMADSGKEYKFVADDIEVTSDMEEEVAAMGKGNQEEQKEETE